MTLVIICVKTRGGRPLTTDLSEFLTQWGIGKLTAKCAVLFGSLDVRLGRQKNERGKSILTFQESFLQHRLP